MYAAAKSLQSCPTLCNPMDCSLPGSSIHGIFQARVLEWVAIAFSCNCIVIHQFKLTAMGEKHHLMRHGDKAQTRLRGLMLWTTALLWPEEVGGRGMEDGWVNYSLGGWGRGTGLTMTKQTTGWDRKSKPMMKADTPSENSNSKENIHRTVLLQILGKKLSMKPQRNHQRILNIT